MDFPAYSNLNPFVRSLAGKTAIGSRLQVAIQPQGGRVMSFALEVPACVPEHEFRWRGKILVRWLYSGEHVFRLTESVDNSCTFVHDESF